MMRSLLFLCGVLGWLVLPAQLYSDHITVNFFLLDECRISQSITGEINHVQETFDRPNFTFVGYFPSAASTPAKINAFRRDYRLSLPLLPDSEQTQTRRYGATIAPQVVVYDEKNERVLYSGRIDNSYARVGQRRRVITAYDLREVLTAITHQRPIETPVTQAVGCVLTLDRP